MPVKKIATKKAKPNAARKEVPIHSCIWCGKVLKADEDVYIIGEDVVCSEYCAKDYCIHDYNICTPATYRRDKNDYWFIKK